MKQFYPIKNRAINKSAFQQTLRAFGNSQMNILENQMKLQKITQGMRKVPIPGGGFLVCRKCFNLKTVDIYYPSQIVEEESKTIFYELQYLSLVFGYAEEKILFSYPDDNELFFPPSGDAVICGDGGSGIYTTIVQNNLYGNFIKCFNTTITAESNSATATIIDSKEKSYDQTYDAKEIFSTIIDDITAQLVSSTMFDSAYDVNLITNVEADNDLTIENSWSKTYDDIIITAISYLDKTRDIFCWQVSISYKDTVLTWGENGDVLSSIFARDVCIGDLCLITRKSHIGFDVWIIKNDAGEEEYYIGLIGEQEAILHQWKYTPENSYLEFDWSISLDKTNPGSSIWAPEDMIPGETARLKRLLRLVGYGFDEEVQKHLVYWSRFNDTEDYALDTVSLSESVTTTYATKNDTNGNPMGIQTAMWNPITKKPFFVWNSLQEEYSGLSGYTGSPNLIHNKEIVSYFEIDCDLCTNESDTIEYIWQDVLLKIPLYTIVPPPEPITTHTYKAISSTKIYGGEKFSKGNFICDTLYLNRGSYITAKSAGVTMDSRCLGATPDDITNTITSVSADASGCSPVGMKDYSFLSGIFTPDDFVFKYSYNTYYKKEIDSSHFSCIRSDNTTEITVGNNQNLFLALSSTFPYDATWKSVLLHGYCRKDTNTSKAETAIKGYVIYKEKISNTLFLFDAFGNRYEISNNADRAFFKQQCIGLEEKI